MVLAAGFFCIWPFALIVLFQRTLTPVSKIDVFGNYDESCSFNKKQTSAVGNYTRKPHCFQPQAKNN